MAIAIIEDFCKAVGFASNSPQEIIPWWSCPDWSVFFLDKEFFLCQIVCNQHTISRQYNKN